MMEQASIDHFLSGYGEEIFTRALRLRGVLLEQLPGITEQLDLSSRMVYYCYGQKYSELICVIIPSKKGLKLGFNRGVELPDPAEGQFLVGQLGWELLRASGLEPVAVGGLTMGADPVAYAIAHTSWGSGEPVDAFSVRKQPKDHGTGKRIEGSFSPGSRVVVIEDVITSGGSALQACEAVKAEGGEVLAVMALLDRDAGGREAIEDAGYRVFSLVRLSEVLEEAAQG